MSKRTVSESSPFGPDGYQDAPPDIAQAIDAAVFIEDSFPSPEELRREIKRSVSIRLDPDVYAWFKRPGPGYQTRINAVLRAYMQAQRSKGSGNGSHAERANLKRFPSVGPTAVKAAKAARSTVARMRSTKKAVSRRRSSKTTRKR